MKPEAIHKEIKICKTIMQEYQNTDIRYCAKSFVDKWKGPVVGGHLAANL